MRSGGVAKWNRENFLSRQLFVRQGKNGRWSRLNDLCWLYEFSLHVVFTKCVRGRRKLFLGLIFFFFYPFFSFPLRASLLRHTFLKSLSPLCAVRSFNLSKNKLKNFAFFYKTILIFNDSAYSASARLCREGQEERKKNRRSCFENLAKLRTFFCILFPCLSFFIPYFSVLLSSRETRRVSLSSSPFPNFAFWLHPTARTQFFVEKAWPGLRETLFSRWGWKRLFACTPLRRCPSALHFD